MSLLEFNPFTFARVFRWVDPDTKFKYEAASMPELLNRIRTYRAQNELEELDYLEATVEDYLCRQPEHLGICREKPPLKRGVIKTLRGGVAVLQNMLYKSFASQEEADRRSAICKDCPFNHFPDRDNFVKWSDDIADMSVQKRRSKYHNDLGTCNGCSCPMRAKVFFNGKISLSDDERTRMKEVNPECWQLVK